MGKTAFISELSGRHSGKKGVPEAYCGYDRAAVFNRLGAECDAGIRSGVVPGGRDYGAHLLW